MKCFDKIDAFNRLMISQDISLLSNGLADGKIGCCIYFYYLSRLESNSNYKSYANHLLDSIYDEIKNETSIDMKNGLAGIGYGITYLIENHYVEGDVNLILSDLDEKIYKLMSNTLMVLNKNSVPDINYIRTFLEVAYYYTIRLENKKITKVKKYILENSIIKIINIIENSEVIDMYEEPSQFSITSYVLLLYLALLEKVYSLNIYNYKIIKIYDELSNKILSTVPVLQSNRLLFCYIIDGIGYYKNNDRVISHLDMLIKSINIDYICKEEIRNKSIFPADGIVGLYLINKKYKKVQTINKAIIIDKIQNSDIWDQCFNDSVMLKKRIGLINGFCGVIMVYNSIIRDL